MPATGDLDSSSFRHRSRNPESPGSSRPDQLEPQTRQFALYTAELLAAILLVADAGLDDLDLITDGSVYGAFSSILSGSHYIVCGAFSG